MKTQGAPMDATRTPRGAVPNVRRPHLPIEIRLFAPRQVLRSGDVGDRERLTKLARVGDDTDHVATAAVAIAFLTPKVDNAADRKSIAFDLGQTV